MWWYVYAFSSKALALSIAVIILALTPTSSLTSWVESRSEIIYSGPSYSIIYKPNIFNAITGSNETRVRVEVQDKTGKPLEFLALLSGPSSRGGVEVGVMGGKGYAVKQIGWYVSEVKRILMELNSDPERSGLGMLILLSTIIEEGEEKYAAADSISIPIIPGKALGKDVIVKVKFKPIMKYKVEEKLTLSGEQLQTAPERITDYCNAPGPNFAYYCYYWRLKEVEYVSSEYAYLPIIVTYLDSKTGSSTGFIIKALEITLIRGTIDYVSFNLSLGFSYKDKISIIAPGPGYVYRIRSDVSSETIYKTDCEIHSTSSPYESRCIRLWGEGIWDTFSESKFSGDVLASLGFRGKMWLLRYEYVFDRAGYIEVVNDNVVAVWLAPKFNSYGKIWAWWEVDGYPYSGWGDTDRILIVS